MHALGKSLIIVWVACVYKICWRLCLYNMLEAIGNDEDKGRPCTEHHHSITRWVDEVPDSTNMKIDCNITLLCHLWAYNRTPLSRVLSVNREGLKCGLSRHKVPGRHVSDVWRIHIRLNGYAYRLLLVALSHCKNMLYYSRQVFYSPF